MTTSIRHNPYSVELRAISNLEDLAIQWRDLEARSNTVSFFNSWSWLGHWLQALPARFERRVIEARHEGRLVGLGLLVRNQRVLKGLPICVSWHLHEAGDPEYDGVMVEHNDFVIDSEHGDELRVAMVQCWARSVGRADELHLPGLRGAGFADRVFGGFTKRDDRRVSYTIELEPVRAQKLDFTPLVSGHARRFIRRSHKEYLTLGPVVLEVAETPEQAVAFFDAMVKLHQERWTAVGKEGSFHSPYVLQLHRKVIAAQLANGEIQLLRVRAGDRDMGYLYSFIRGKRLYVYQSGFDYSLLEKHGRPGLTTHVMAIQYNASLGYDVYDLMVGESQYKSTIATHREEMTWTVCHRPALRFWLEDRVKDVARRIRHRSSNTQEDKTVHQEESSDA